MTDTSQSPAPSRQKKTVHVAVGILLNAANQILLAKRADHQHQGGLWEFPGGKVETEETVFDALVREFQEEVDMTIQQAEPMMSIHHDYGDKQVLLDVWLSRDFTGEAKGKENQEVCWVPLADLLQYNFPEANKVIVEALLKL